MKIRGQTVFPMDIRLQRLSTIDPDTGCWNWTSSTRNNYGRLIVGSRTDGTRKSVSAHRLSYETFVGTIPDGMVVCHKCDNPKCINPDHLFVGTRQDNVDDREAKNRNNHFVGESSGRAKLSETDVVSMRRLREKGETFQSIADRFGVAKKTTIQAVKGETWKHIPKPPVSARSE